MHAHESAYTIREGEEEGEEEESQLFAHDRSDRRGTVEEGTEGAHGLMAGGFQSCPSLPPTSTFGSHGRVGRKLLRGR